MSAATSPAVAPPPRTAQTRQHAMRVHAEVRRPVLDAGAGSRTWKSAARASTVRPRAMAAGISQVVSLVSALYQYGWPVCLSKCSVQPSVSRSGRGDGGVCEIAISVTSCSTIDPYELGRFAAHCSLARVPDEAFLSRVGFIAECGEELLQLPGTLWF